MPLVVGDEPLGVLAILGRELPTDDVRLALAPIVDLLALGIGRARAEEDRAASLERERRARADAEAANRSKDEFLAVVSHELRTPLNAITGWTRILLGGTVDRTRQMAALQTIERNARAQAQLIDDLLDVGRIISGNLTLHTEQVDVAAVVELALGATRLAAEAKAIAFEVNIDPVAGTLTGIRDRLRQVLWNLLSNAIKFTPKGGLVSLSATREGDMVVVRVKDTGRGIEPSFLPYVFERFRQGDASATRSSGGLGLGLAIVRQLVELHGGTVGAESEGLGTGATFVVRLPVHQAPATPVDRWAQIARSDPPREGASAPFVSPSGLASRRALVVDVERDWRVLVKAMLESCAMTVTTASSAAEAFEALRTSAPEVLVSDIAMPGEDGLSLIRRVRALPCEEGGSVPAVALTAYARLEDRTKALRAGFNHHVTKPVDLEDLVAALSSALALP